MNRKSTLHRRPLFRGREHLNYFGFRALLIHVNYRRDRARPPGGSKFAWSVLRCKYNGSTGEQRNCTTNEISAVVRHRPKICQTGIDLGSKGGRGGLNPRGSWQQQLVCLGIRSIATRSTRFYANKLRPFMSIKGHKPHVLFRAASKRLTHCSFNINAQRNSIGVFLF